MKGIVLAGGKGSRLYPMTLAISKQLIPIYDKPLIYYPLSVLLISGIRDILIISTEKEAGRYQELFGDGTNLGIDITYATQDSPHGIGEAFIIGRRFVGGERVSLALGDNIFYGQGFSESLDAAVNNETGATIFGYKVKNPSEFGVVEFDEEGNVVSLEEKPELPKSKYAVPGLYFYDNDVLDIAKDMEPSPRGELEITDINRTYLERERLRVEILGRGLAWLDTGTPEGLLQASSYVEAIQSRQGMYIACIEEVAWRKGFIDDAKLQELGNSLKMTDYGKYILTLLD